MTPTSWWLFLRFAQREVSNRFAGSLLGGVWALVHPLALLLIYSFVFTTVLRVRPVGDTTVPYLVFLGVALWPWLAFQESVARGTSAVVANGALVKKVPFAHELVVYAAVASSFAVQLGGYLVVLAFMALTGQPLHAAGLGLVVFCLLALAALATGFALMLSALHVFVRDVEQGLTPVLGIVFYLSPIVYTAAMVPDWLRGYMMMNPVAVLIEACRAALVDGRMLPGVPEGMAAVVCLAVLVLGRVVFHRLAPHFEEAL